MPSDRICMTARRRDSLLIDAMSGDDGARRYLAGYDTRVSDLCHGLTGSRPVKGDHPDWSLGYTAAVRDLG